MPKWTKMLRLREWAKAIGATAGVVVGMGMSGLAFSLFDAGHAELAAATLAISCAMVIVGLFALKVQSVRMSDEWEDK
jgi:hypothetical protein